MPSSRAASYGDDDDQTKHVAGFEAVEEETRRFVKVHVVGGETTIVGPGDTGLKRRGRNWSRSNRDSVMDEACRNSLIDRIRFRPIPGARGIR